MRVATCPMAYVFNSMQLSIFPKHGNGRAAIWLGTSISNLFKSFRAGIFDGNIFFCRLKGPFINVVVGCPSESRIGPT